jgi:hypothetical protein
MSCFCLFAHHPYRVGLAKGSLLPPQPPMGVRTRTSPVLRPRVVSIKRFVCFFPPVASTRTCAPTLLPGMAASDWVPLLQKRGFELTPLPANNFQLPAYPRSYDQKSS